MAPRAPREPRQPRTRANEPKLPDAFKACRDGWIQQPNNQEAFKVMSEMEFVQEFLYDSLLDSYRQYAERIPMEAALIGSQYSSPADGFRVLLSDVTLLKIVRFTNGFLHNMDLLPTNLIEYQQFLMHKFLLSRYNGPIEMTFNEELPMLATKYAFHVMDVQRFKALLQATHGFPIDNRVGDDEDETWMQKSNILRNLNEIENDLFQPSVKLMLNKKSGILVVDDELISSRAKDVEKKTLSYRKAGKDGPVSDCISDSVTGIMLGMRLRVSGESQQDNVEQLIDTLPTITSNQDKVRMCFDRGYGKMSFIENTCARNYNVSTVASTAGSRHPYILADEAKKLVADWNAKRCTEEAQTRVYDTFREFVLPEGDLLGPDVRVATKELVLPNGRRKKVIAAAMRDKYDSNDDSKDLRFFSSGEAVETMMNIWIAKDVSSVTSNTLFKKRRVALPVETKLLLSCKPVTLSQRCADWFCQRTFRLTGTTVGQFLATRTDDSSGDLRLQRFKKCLDSWFARHPSSAAMRIGSLNEVPVTERLAKMDFVKNFYDIGLVEWNDAPFIAVSPDGVVEFIPPQQPGRIELACVEIKTRSAGATIQAAEEASRKHGFVVQCKFGDDVFNDCVPSENRHQLLHQALVTGLQYGLFVVSKVEATEGSLIQIVVVEVTAEDKNAVRGLILNLGQDLIGWCYNPDILSRGFLTESDFPDWLAANSYEAMVLKSHYKLWAAQYKNIRGDGQTYIPTLPIASYKYALQYVYNKGKWGVDKNTESCFALSINAKVSFETKYLLRMIDGLMYNHWRFVLAVNHIQPFLAGLERRPSHDAIRRKAWEYSFREHIFKTAVTMLAKLEVERRLQLATAAAEQSRRDLLTLTENEVLRDVDQLRQRNKFPVRAKRAKIFHRESVLKRLRLLETRNVRHTNDGMGPANYGKSCSLCLASRSSYWCEACSVTLCKRCYRPWHSVDNLWEAHQNAVSQWEAARATRRETRGVQMEAVQQAVADIEEELDGEAIVEDLEDPAPENDSVNGAVSGVALQMQGDDRDSFEPSNSETDSD